MSVRVYPEQQAVLLVKEIEEERKEGESEREMFSSKRSSYNIESRSPTLSARILRNEQTWIGVSREEDEEEERRDITSDLTVIEEIDLEDIVHSLPLQSELLAIEESHRLIYYFKWLNQHSSVKDIDMDFINQLLKEGASVTVKDSESSFSVLHYIAMCWHHSVADVMIEHGCDIDCIDERGRTPLHIAAYNDHTEMVSYLIQKGAQINIRSSEGQTPVHYAVRASSINTLDILIKEYNASYDKDCRDNEGRTPLQLGAELDRTEAVGYLLSLDNPSGCDVCDNKGHPALTSMIINMPQMAKLALDQLHKVMTSERRQEYLLSRVESSVYKTKTPFEATIEWNASDVLTHPVMRKLIDIKWKRQIRWYFLIDFTIFLLFLIVWSILIAYPPIQDKHSYEFPQDTWRVLLGLLGLALLASQIANEVLEYVNSFNKRKKYMEWLFPRLHFDLDNCHGIGFEEERQFIRNKLTEKVRTRYFTNAWNYIDILTYFLLLVVIVLHVIDIGSHSQDLAQWNARIASIAVILTWLKLLAYLRASPTLGPMVAILSHVTGKIAQYLIIFGIFFFPYVINYWLLFGGPEQSLANVTSPSPELTSVHRLFVVLYRMSVIDDYPYEAIRDTDELSGTLLTLSFLLINSIIALNLFIALLSDTFQRVYDNAFVNAEFQKASLILVLEDKGPRRWRKSFFHYIHKYCNPAADYYDDDENIELAGGHVVALGKITHQTNKLVRQLTELLSEQKEEISELQNSVNQLKQQVESIVQSPTVLSTSRQPAVLRPEGPLRLSPVVIRTAITEEEGEREERGREWDDVPGPAAAELQTSRWSQRKTVTAASKFKTIAKKTQPGDIFFDTRDQSSTANSSGRNIKQSIKKWVRLT